MKVSSDASCRRAGIIGVLLVPLLYFALGLATIHDYGESSDEDSDRSFGKFYLYEYGLKGHDIESRFDLLQRNYAPFFDIIAVAGHDLLVDRLRWVHDSVVGYHLFVLAASALLLAVVFRIGALAFDPATGLCAQAALLLLPQFIGHSHNNMRDQPVSLFFALAMLAFVTASKRGTLRWWVLAGAAGGVAFAAKINGIFVLPVIGVWQVAVARRDVRALPGILLRLTLAAVAFAAILPLLWPYYRWNVPAHIVETVRAFHNHYFNDLIFYLGQHLPAREIAWHFPLVMFAVTTPLLQLTLVLGGFALLFRALRRGDSAEADPLLLCAIWLCLPLAVQIASQVPRSDGVRHYLFLLPAMSLLAGRAAVQAWRAAERHALGPRWMRAAVAAIPVLLLTRTLVLIHPYQVAFFNLLVGGPRGAHEYFELDYYGTSLLAASRWMDANFPAGTRVWFTQPGIHRFKLDFSRVQFVGKDERPMYKINLLRGQVRPIDTDDDYLHPRRPVFWQVTALGAPLLQIFRMDENLDIPDGASIAPSTAPAHVEDGLMASFSRDFEPHEPLAPLSRLTVEPLAAQLSNRMAELLAQGYLRVDRSGTYEFQVHSDDSTTIWLGEHALMTAPCNRVTTRKVVLRPGLYDWRLKYRNDSGVGHLQVRWKPPDEEALREMSGSMFVHDPAATISPRALQTYLQRAVSDEREDDQEERQNSEAHSP